MNISKKNVLVLLAAAALAVPFAVPSASGESGSTGGSNAANKTAAAGSTLEILGPGLTGGADSLSATVLATTIKTSPTADLIFSVSLECALWTTVETVGNDVSESTARVVITVLFDGAPVPIWSGDDDGSVVFCDRTHRQTTTMFDDENATIEQYLATRSANAFNWILPDVGGGTHTVEVVATLSGEATDNAFTMAGVGHRTLIVETTHMPQGASVTSGTGGAGGSGSGLAASRAPNLPATGSWGLVRGAA